MARHEGVTWQDERATLAKFLDTSYTSAQKRVLVNRWKVDGVSIDQVRKDCETAYHSATTSILEAAAVVHEHSIVLIHATGMAEQMNPDGRTQFYQLDTRGGALRLTRLLNSNTKPLLVTFSERGGGHYSVLEHRVEQDETNDDVDLSAYIGMNVDEEDSGDDYEDDDADVHTAGMVSVVANLRI